MQWSGQSTGGDRRAIALLTRAFACALLLAASLLAPGPARAQEAPVDVGAGWSADAEAAGPAGVTLPVPPEDYETEERGDVTWTFPSAATSEARELQEAFADSWRRIEDDLGEDVDDELVIRIGRDPEEMRALAPVGHPPPDYASGVAYPRLGIILLTLTAPETWERPDMEAVLTHELSHVALHRAIEGNPVPRWFSEGLAIYQAGEYSLDRARTLWSAVVAGNVVSLDRISGRFPSRPHRVNVAYAESADMVAFMRRDSRDARSFRILIRHLGDGVEFEEAVRESYDATLPSLEREWRLGLQERFQTLPLLVTGGSVWVLVSLFVVLVWIRKRRRDRRRLADWAEEEAAEDEAMRRAELAVLTELREAATAEEEETVRVVVPDEPPGGREPDVPTVEYDGRNHTLH